MEIKIPLKRICGDITHSKQNLERNVILQETLLFCLHSILRGHLGGGTGPSYRFWPQVQIDMHRGWVASLCQIKVSICSLQHCLPQVQRLQSQRPWNLELAWLCTVWQALQGFISRPGRVHLQWEFSSPTSRVSGAFINSSAAFIQHMHCFTSMYVWPPCLELFELPELRSKFKMMDSFRNLSQQTVYFNWLSWFCIWSSIQVIRSFSALMQAVFEFSLTSFSSVKGIL